MFHTKFFPFFLLCLIVASVVLLPGCRQEIDTVDVPVDSLSNTMMTARDIDVLYSDSGIIQARVSGPLVYRNGGDDPWTEFPEGFRAEMYDSAGNLETTITSDYAKRFEMRRLMEAKGNVVVRNEFKQQQLNTEELIWNEVRHMIHTELPVKITTPDKVLFGDGLKANETFTEYKILKPRGEMTVADSVN
jgi:LPS export ABC transporter protein LptC